MSDKFDMKLVIDEVTTPLLHARLSAATSYRERAALLRSLAESALRVDSVPVSLMPSFVRAPPARTEEHSARSGEKAAVTGAHIEPGTIRPDMRPDNGEETGGSHDVEMIADQFAAFL